MGALTLPAWKSFFKKYLNRSAAHLLTEERTPIDPGVTAMLEHFQAPSPSEHDIKVGGFWVWLVAIPSLQGEIRGGQEWWNILSFSEHL